MSQAKADALGMCLGEIAEQYDEITADSWNQQLPILQKIETSNISSVLDFGCGTGNVAGYFLEKGAAVDAVDVDNRMLEVAKRKFSNLNTFLCDDEGKSDNYKSEYDLVVADKVLHHVHEPLAVLEVLVGKATKAFLLVDFPTDIEKFTELLVKQGFSVAEQSEFDFQVTEEHLKIV